MDLSPSFALCLRCFLTLPSMFFSVSHWLVCQTLPQQFVQQQPKSNINRISFTPTIYPLGCVIRKLLICSLSVVWLFYSQFYLSLHLLGNWEAQHHPVDCLQRCFWTVPEFVNLRSYRNRVIGEDKGIRRGQLAMSENKLLWVGLEGQRCHKRTKSREEPAN